MMDNERLDRGVVFCEEHVKFGHVWASAQRLCQKGHGYMGTVPEDKAKQSHSKASDAPQESPGNIVQLTKDEEKQVRERTSLRAAVVFETVRREGEVELSRAPLALAFSGLAAGLSMGFSLVGTGLFRAYLPH